MSSIYGKCYRIARGFNAVNGPTGKITAGAGYRLKSHLRATVCGIFAGITGSNRSSYSAADRNGTAAGRSNYQIKWS